jgi:hypothetical protein
LTTAKSEYWLHLFRFRQYLSAPELARRPVKDLEALQLIEKWLEEERKNAAKDE